MKCADPKLCYTDSRGNKQFRHFSLATPIFKRMAQAVFNCDQCIFCRKRRAYELACKCVLHSSLYRDNCFLTLTYDESQPTYHNDFDYTDIQKFKKRLRRSVEYHYEKKIEIFNVHEYGKRGKKHWHLIVFNHDFADKELHTVRRGLPLYTSPELAELWPFGFNAIGDVSAASAMYQAQYVEKDLKNGNSQNSRKSHSKHSGIGRPYFELHFRDILRNGFIPIGGKKLPVPRSFQRIAHKHYCHYFEPSAFHDNSERKALYRPFVKKQPNREIAELFKGYRSMKAERVLELEREWDEFISLHLTEKTEPDFMKAASNTIYDLTKKQMGDKF